MYLRITNDGSYLSYSQRIEESIVVSSPHWWDRWAIKRLTASLRRYYFQNIVATLILLAGMVAIGWWLFSVVSGFVFLYAIIVLMGLLACAMAWVSFDTPFFVSTAYTWLANWWIGHKHTTLVNQSWALRSLVGQVEKKTLGSSADLARIHTWLVDHPELARDIDEILADPWVIDAEKVLSSPDTSAQSKEDIVSIRDGIAAATWPLVQQIISANTAATNAAASRAKELAANAPRIDSDDAWTQPPKASTSTAGRKDLR